MAAWEKKDPKFLSRLRLSPDQHLPRVSAITLGEIEAGLQMTTASNPVRREDYLRFVNSDLLRSCVVENVTERTRYTYSAVMGEIWKAHPPANAGISTDAHLLNTLKININDVWLVAQALEHNMTLLTTDRMKLVRALVTVSCDNWLV